MPPPILSKGTFFSSVSPQALYLSLTKVSFPFFRGSYFQLLSILYTHTVALVVKNPPPPPPLPMLTVLQKLYGALNWEES